MLSNKAIAEYLGANGYSSSLAEFQKEAEVVIQFMDEPVCYGANAHMCTIVWSIISLLSYLVLVICNFCHYSLMTSTRNIMVYWKRNGFRS